jgi:hypothetical protein
MKHTITLTAFRRPDITKNCSKVWFGIILRRLRFLFTSTRRMLFEEMKNLTSRYLKNARYTITVNEE